ncbi:hypothetical protein PAPYR_10556 [Paratrimastix pyriformis]|uniref:Integron gene cassette protein n=1 Tax=Paratrimastix pyriformis TaxID=342808 RepID=A0ABQ8UBE6_9EUKA|nr:hypothetical protein PAPYR_10556 [Paratrimastix pyriformis]
MRFEPKFVIPLSALAACGTVMCIVGCAVPGHWWPLLTLLFTCVAFATAFMYPSANDDPHMHYWFQLITAAAIASSLGLLVIFFRIQIIYGLGFGLFLAGLLLLYAALTVFVVYARRED